MATPSRVPSSLRRLVAPAGGERLGAVLREGYLFGVREAARSGSSDAVPVRVGGRRHVLLHGAAAAQVFYDDAVMGRHRAVPARISHVLFGRGAVHGRHGDEHRHRKAMFLDVLAPGQVAALEAVPRETEASS